MDMMKTFFGSKSVQMVLVAAVAFYIGKKYY